MESQRSSSRVKKPTVKGREYRIDTLRRHKDSLYREIYGRIDLILNLIKSGGKVNLIEEEMSALLSRSIEFKKVNSRYCELVPSDPDPKNKEEELEID